MRVPRLSTAAATPATLITSLVIPALGLVGLLVSILVLSTAGAQDQVPVVEETREMAERELLDRDFLNDQLLSDETISDGRAALSNLNERRDAVNGEIDGMRLDVEILADRLANTEFSIINQERLVEQARLAQRTMAMQRTEILVEISTIQADVDALKQALVDKAVTAYMIPRADANAEYLASASVTEAQTKMVLIDALADRDVSVIDQLAAREAALARNEFTLAELATEAAKVHTEEMLTQESLEANRVEYEYLQELLATKIAASEAVVSSLDSQQFLIDQEIAERHEQLRVIATKRAERRARCESQGGTVTDDGEEIDCSFLGAQPAPGSMVWPLFTDVSSEFGPRMHPIALVERMHDGIDFDGATGDPIGAAAAGEVFFVGWISGYGNTTLIDHGGGVETLYAHQSDFAVSEGDFVEAGQTIGYVGSTGNSTGPHLHFEVSVDGAPVDPRDFLS